MASEPTLSVHIDGWVYLRSPLDHSVRVHPTDIGKIALYERYGWEQYRPVVRTLADILGGA